jgi:hypothetical protein
MYVATDDPEDIADHLTDILKRWFRSTWTHDYRGLCLACTRKAEAERGLYRDYEKAKKPFREPLPNRPAEAFEYVRKEACRNDTYVFIVLNPADWFIRESVVSTLLDWARTRNERQALMIVFVGPPDLQPPEAIRPFMPRIEAGSQLDKLDKPNPLPRDAGTSLEETTKIVTTIMGKLLWDQKTSPKAVQKAVPIIAERLVGLEQPMIDIMISQMVILAKPRGPGAPSVPGSWVDPLTKDPAGFVAKALDGWERICGWPV